MGKSYIRFGLLEIENRIMDKELKKKSNRISQIRFFKKRKLYLAALKFIQRLYNHRPPGMQPAQVRHLHIRIASILQLPWGWTDDDLKRANNMLRKLERQTYAVKYDDFSGNYQNLLTAVLEPLQTFAGTVQERADVVAEAMFAVGMELNAIFGDKRPEVAMALLFALAVGRAPFAKWVPDALVDFILEHFRQDECVHICNTLYDKLAEDLQVINNGKLEEVAAEEPEEIVVGVK